VNLPAAVRAAVESAIAERTGLREAVSATSPVGGGCISPTLRLTTDSGSAFFLKLGAPDLPAGMLDAEARGLEALAATRTVRVPDVVGHGDGGGGASSAWLLLEWLEPGQPRDGTWEALGRELAALHRHRGDRARGEQPGGDRFGGGRFGADHDNYIGPLPQANDPTADWPGFWRDRRLEPQLAAAVDAGLLERLDVERFQRLFQRLDDLLAPAADDGPSLLHGDLWNGNVHVVADGTAALVDPSAYHGHREVDLAMADLFGGFPAAFRHAYDEAWPLAPGYAPARRAVYQLYYLLVHVNLFGPGYVSGTRSALRQAGV
jgi:protein-ribulosamine 3-kinase